MLCKRCVRQGDSLSILLFCFVKDVLNRCIIKSVNDNKLTLINSIEIVMSFHICYMQIMS